MRCYHVGYYINRYAGWFKIESFETATDLVRWLYRHSSEIDGDIDFICFKVM